MFMPPQNWFLKIGLLIRFCVSIPYICIRLFLYDSGFLFICIWRVTVNKTVLCFSFYRSLNKHHFIARYPAHHIIINLLFFGSWKKILLWSNDNPKMPERGFVSGRNRKCAHFFCYVHLRYNLLLA